MKKIFLLCLLTVGSLVTAHSLFAAETPTSLCQKWCYIQCGLVDTQCYLDCYNQHCVQ